MTDNLVKWLRSGGVAEMDKVADHIEKLEAALQRANANVEEYERKFYLGTDRIEKLEAALRMVIDWDNTLDWEDGPVWGDLMEIVSKALEGKDD